MSFRDTERLSEANAVVESAAEVAMAPGTDQTPSHIEAASRHDDSAWVPLPAHETALKEKDRLVQALTEQLERAADRIDRLQRSGADRRHAAPAAGALPADVVDAHRETIDEMQRVVHQWDDMQAGLMLGRIELQISELRDLIVERTQEMPLIPDPGRPADLAALLGETGHFTQALPDSEKSEPVNAVWESLKSELLNESNAASGSKDQANSTSSFAENSTVESGGVATFTADIGPEPEAPRPIPLDTASPEDIAAAIDERDAMIAYLIRRLRMAEHSGTPAWMSHPQTPEELQSRHAELIGRLESTLRMTEVELSLERARLAREHVRLRQQNELLDKQLQHYRVPGAAETTTAPDRRWLRYFGVSRSN